MSVRVERLFSNACFIAFLFFMVSAALGIMTHEFRLALTLTLASLGSLAFCFILMITNAEIRRSRLNKKRGGRS